MALNFNEQSIQSCKHLKETYFPCDTRESASETVVLVNASIDTHRENGYAWSALLKIMILSCYLRT